jgi:hypothetical protein
VSELGSSFSTLSSTRVRRADVAVGDRRGCHSVHQTHEMRGHGGRGELWLWSSALLTILAVAMGPVLAPSASAAPAAALTWLLFLGSSAHVAATGYLFTVPDVRTHIAAHRHRYVFVPVGLIVLAALLAGLLGPSQLQWLLLLYFCWQFFHFQRQNLGMVALAASVLALRSPTSAERWPLLLAAGAGILRLCARPSLLQLHLATHLGVMTGLAGGLYLVAIVSGVRALVTRPSGRRGPGYGTVYLSSLGFFVPLFLFRSPYAAVAGVTIAHGLQYLLLVGLVAASRHQTLTRTCAMATFVNVGLVGGSALALASHLHAGPAARRLVFGAYLGLVMAHFVVDGGLWRLREPFPRAFLSTRLPFLVAPAAATDSVDDRSVADI